MSIASTEPEAVIQKRRGPKDLSEVIACLSSASCHMGLLIVLGLISAALHGSSSSEKLSVVLGSGPGNLGGDAGKLEGDDAFDQTLNANASAAAEEVLSSESLSAMQPTPLTEGANAWARSTNVADKALLIDDLDQVLGPQKMDGKSARKGMGGKGTGGVGDGTGGGGDPNGQPGFFGIPSNGRSVVYVMDCSGSMSEHGKFKLACRELLKSISQLTSRKRFFVILYSDGAYPMDADEPVAATPDKIEELRSWLEKVEPAGGTQPLGPLLYALSMKPDEIYFLSDGQFDVSLIMQLKQANSGKPIPIHTIDLMNYQTQGLMKMISRRSGGKFRFVQ